MGDRSSGEASHSVCCRPGRAGATREDVVLKARAVIPLSWSAGELVKCAMTPSSRNVEELLAGGQLTNINSKNTLLNSIFINSFLPCLSLFGNESNR